jgi:hypothetical protein
MWSRSQTMSSAEQSRSEVQDDAPVAHTFALHDWPSGQSLPVLHSTQMPSVALQTSPGHMREDVHGVDATHACAMHVLPVGQSVAAVQPALASSGEVA